MFATDDLSVARARAQQQQDRALASAVFGFPITDDPIIVTPSQVTKAILEEEALHPPALVVVSCVRKGCWFAAATATEEEAIAKVESHIQRKHGAVVVSIAERR